MKKFVIITDSCSDLDLSFREKHNIEYVAMHYSYDGNDVVSSLDWEEISAHEFYDLMRNGKRILTSQVTSVVYKEAFEKWIKEGYDILSLSCSSALSASVKASIVAKEELLKTYPDAKIITIDCKIACGGLGLLCIHADELRQEGKTIDEVASWVEENKTKVHQVGTVADLKYLKQAGRISSTSAFFGGLLNIKPIIIADSEGRNVSVEKVKGRKVSINRIAELVKENFVDVPYQMIHIGHADCLDDALELKQAIIDQFPGKELKFHITYISCPVGASVGPGMMGVYFYGVDKKEKEKNNG